MTILAHDHETASEVDLKEEGLDRYASHPSTRVLMTAYKIDDGPVRLWTAERGRAFPLTEMLLDPKVIKVAFNAQFERTIARKVLKIDTPYTNWRCTMALAYSQSYVGNLEDIGKQMGLSEDKQKNKRGKALIRMFCSPDRKTGRIWKPHEKPEEWEEFKRYCVQDVIAEEHIRERLERFPIADREWDLYELDQRINDTGLPIDMRFVSNAMRLSKVRRDALFAEIKAISGVANPGAPAQMLAWLKTQGYPFDDMQKDTVVKALKERDEYDS